MIGRKAKSSLHKKVVSMGKKRPIIQNAKSFTAVAADLMKTTTIKYFTVNGVNPMPVKSI